MNEIVLNLHIHTKFSDGSLTHQQIAQAASRAGLDAILITDHNVHPSGLEGYYQEGDKKVLVMIGEEIHNPDRQPQKSHLLVFGINDEMAKFGSDPQNLIDEVNKRHGICFIAHPYDPSLPAFHEDNISWEDWQASGYQGLELWNGFSELKVRAHNKWQAIFLGLFPKLIAHQPPKQTLDVWDGLMAAGKRVNAIGGSDSHAGKYHIGPIHKTIFPYEFHFRAINTHVLLSSPLSGDSTSDSKEILDALKNGHCFIAYDLPALSRGFRFGCKNNEINLGMGDEAKFFEGIILSVHVPNRCECVLLKDGEIIQLWKNKSNVDYSIQSPGVYRVECYRRYLGKKRGWIFSNPIYVR